MANRACTRCWFQECRESDWVCTDENCPCTCEWGDDDGE